VQQYTQRRDTDGSARNVQSSIFGRQRKRVDREFSKNERRVDGHSFALRTPLWQCVISQRCRGVEVKPPSGQREEALCRIAAGTRGLGVVVGMACSSYGQAEES
jgi:hypothetical protein